MRMASQAMVTSASGLRSFSTRFRSVTPMSATTLSRYPPRDSIQVPGPSSVGCPACRRPKVSQRSQPHPATLQMRGRLASSAQEALPHTRSTL